MFVLTQELQKRLLQTCPRDTAKLKVLQVKIFENYYEFFKTSVVSYKIGIYL